MKSSVEYVTVIADLLSILKKFSVCAVCGRRLQLWMSQKDVNDISAIFGEEISYSYIAEKICYLLL